MTHRNARLTPTCRRLIVERHHNDWKQAHIATVMGISRRCVARWINRYRTEGQTCLEDRPLPAPHPTEQNPCAYRATRPTNPPQ